MDQLEEMLLAEIRHIQERLRIMSSYIIDHLPPGLSIEDGLILQEIADGFDDELGGPEKPTLKVVKKDAH